MKKPKTQNNTQVWDLYIPIFFIVLNLVIIGIIYLIRDHIPPQIPLYYGRPQGEEQLADQMSLIVPPAIVVLLSAINTILINAVKHEFLKKVLVGIIVVTTLLSAVTVVKVITLVGSF